MAIQIPDRAVCLDCGYSLRGLPEAVCPECGRAFDPADSRTYTVNQPQTRRRWRLILAPTPLGAVLYILIPLFVGVIVMLVLRWWP